MDLFDLIRIAVFLAYLTGTALILAGTLTRREPLLVAGRGATVAGFGLHAADLAVWLVTGALTALGHGEFYLSLFSWCLLLAAIIAWVRLKIAFIALVAAPLTLFLYTVSFAVSGLTIIIPKQLSGLFFGLHIGSLYASMALLAMAFGAGLVFVSMETKIKHKEKLTAFGKDMPSLSAFDRANQLAVLAGFPLYTLGLLSGFIWSGLTREHMFSWHPREITALITWLLFAVLFHQRVVLGWRGRKAARFAIGVFIFTMASMLAVILLFPTHHSFIKPN